MFKLLHTKWQNFGLFKYGFFPATAEVLTYTQHFDRPSYVSVRDIIMLEKFNKQFPTIWEFLYCQPLENPSSFYTYLITYVTDVVVGERRQFKASCLPPSSILNVFDSWLSKYITLRETD